MKKMSAVSGFVLGASLAYLFDPDRGRSRRAKLADQLGAISRKAVARANARARYQKGVATGIAHRVTEPLRGDEEIDDDTLLQKVRSEAVGPSGWPTQDLEIDIDAGVVTLRGTAPRPGAERKLIKRIRGVNGVISVNNELEVAGRS